MNLDALQRRLLADAIELFHGGARHLHQVRFTFLEDVERDGRHAFQTTADVQQVRDIELERCDAMIVGLWRKVEAGDTKAVLAACRVMDRRAKLLGLDASTKIDLAGTLTVESDVTIAIRRELDRFAALHAGSGLLPAPVD